MTTTTATVLFCDIVGSTAHRAELGEVDADRFFVAVEQRFRTLVDDAGGQVIKGGGDGIMATFNASSDAVAAAVALQRGTAAQSPEIRLRIGVEAGDVTREGDDCYGMPVVVAARLESAAEPGAIYVSGVVRALAGSRVNAEYEAVGALELKGVPDPVDAFRVVWNLPDEVPTGWVLPAVLPTLGDMPFVGRSSEFGELMSSWSLADAGGSGLVLLGGEAGAGKTRLATELAHVCHRDGAMVLAGLCDRELSLPYQPWVMIVDQLVNMLPPSALDDLRAPLGHVLGLAPHIADSVGGLVQPAPTDPEIARVRMFDAVAALLRSAASMAPILLVLDDVHWAGSQTLDLMRYLVVTNPVERCLVVVTHRDTVDEIDAHFATALADFRRHEAALHLKVDGISSDAVHELLDHGAVGGDLRVRAQSITERTHGNAFLVTELLRAAADPGGDGSAAVPESVADVVRGRMQRLGPDSTKLAGLIAVGGRVELRVLLEATKDDDVDLASGLAELSRSGLVNEMSAAVPSYYFAHALIRDAVAAGLSSFERANLHHHLALAYEQVHTADRRAVLPDLARHFAAASALAGWEKAAYYGRRAVAQAHRTAAYEEAIELIEHTLTVTPQGSRERAELMIDAAQLFERCGRSPEAVEYAGQAAQAATELDEPVLAARASIELERAAHLANAALDRSLPRLRRVLEGRDSLPPPMTIQATASLGRAAWLTGADGARTLTAEALAAARELGDDETISHALEMACVIEEDPRRALELAVELERSTAAQGNVFQSMWAMTRQTDALLMLGRLAEAEAVLDRLRAESDRYRFTSYRYLSLVFTHTLALAAAAFEQSEEATDAANTAVQSEFAGLDASGAYGLQMFMIRRAQGQLEEMRPVLRILAQQAGVAGVWRPGLLVAYIELGMFDEATAGFDDMMDNHWDEAPRDTLWPLAVSFLADACVALERTDAADRVFAELAPYAGQTLRAGYTTNGGPADRCRAAMAELAGRSSEADECIRDAHALAVESQSPLWLAMTESTWAWMLARRGETAAEAHHAQACEIADLFRLGCVPRSLPGLAGLSEGGASPGAAAAAALPDGLSEREADVIALLAEGFTNRQIADELFISPNTAANHVRAILRKTASANRTEAAAYAFNHGLARTNNGG